jgi:hypothetical protein
VSDPYVIEAYKAAVDVVAASPSLHAMRRQLTPADAAKRLILALQGRKPATDGTQTSFDRDSDADP